MNFEEWHARDPAVLREKAEGWRDATNAKDQKKIFEDYGVRWSEIWRLPYWNPSRQLVIDPMHCLLEGLVQDHFRYTLGLTSAEADIVDKPVPSFEYSFLQVPDQNLDPGNPIFAVGSNEYLTVAEREQVLQIHCTLQEPLDDSDIDLKHFAKKLYTRNRAPLEFVARSIGYAPSVEDVNSKRRKHKGVWIEALKNWVC
jgi:hypothetical protein